MDRRDKAAGRWKALVLARRIGNVAKACRIAGMDRTSFYKWKKRYKRYGMIGLLDRPSIPKTHPQSPSAEVEEQVLALARLNDQWGCARLSAGLKLQGVFLSAPTIQKILMRRQFKRQRAERSVSRVNLRVKT